VGVNTIMKKESDLLDQEIANLIQQLRLFGYQERHIRGFIREALGNDSLRKLSPLQKQLLIQYLSHQVEFASLCLQNREQKGL